MTSTAATVEPAASVPTDAFLSVLRDLVGAEQVVVGEEKRAFYSTDIDRPGETVEAVVRVASTAQVAAVVRASVGHGRVVIPRGGGFSYTGGYRAVQPHSVTLDMRGMNRIVEINVADLYVVVEAGCTWERLYEALKAEGVRTPYFGPMSGYNATVGGALSQGSFFLGSSQHGPVAESVLAIEVVLADGSVVKTGSWGGTNGSGPFMRNYGPDLTGLFLSDTGAFGFKTTVALRLIPFPQHQQYGSFAFDDEDAAVRATSAIGRAGLAAECYCWDPYFVAKMAQQSTGLAEDLKFLAGVAKGGGSRAKGLFNAARVAMAGKRVFSGNTFLLNICIDDLSEDGANARLKAVRAIVDAEGGSEIAPSAPMALRGTPFTNFNVDERRTLTRNLPTNSLSPHSRIVGVGRAVREFLAEHQATMDAHGIACGVIYLAVGANAVCCEPLLYWDDEEYFLHNRVTEASDLDALARFAERPAATAVAQRLRKEMTAMFTTLGCTHVQIGKSYPYLETRDAPTRDLLVGLKRLLDPHGRINPGSLGFDAG